MGEIIHQTVAQQGVLAITQYVLLFPLVVTAVLAGWRTMGNVLHRTSP